MKRYQIITGYPLEQSTWMVLEGIIHNMDLYQKQIKKADNAVHQSRKSIKRIRALLKMIRDETGYSFYYRENTFFRDLARKMSTARDFTVLLETLNHIEKKHKGKLNESEVEILRDQITSRMKAQIQPLKSSKAGFSGMASEMDHALERIHTTLRLRDGFGSVGLGIRRIYRRARNYLSELDSEPCMETLHEYRKNCRYLQYQMELIQPIFPDLLKAYAASLDRHAETLGKVRDFQRFEVYIQNETAEVVGGSGKETILNAARQLRLRATEEAFRNADLLFAEKPRVFIERIHLYWNIHYNIN